MVSFDVPFARIDAKGLGNGGRHLSVKKIAAARRPAERLYALPRRCPPLSGDQGRNCGRSRWFRGLDVSPRF
jgi:hypothetical protein